MANAWTDILFHIGREKHFDGVVKKIPANIDCVIYNGDHLIMLAAEELIQFDNEVPSDEDIISKIKQYIVDNIETVVLYSVNPSAYCIFNNMQSTDSISNDIRHMFGPGSDRHKSITNMVSKTEGDFITKMHSIIRYNDKNIIVVDNSDMTLLAMLYRQKKEGVKLYYSKNIALKVVIDVTILRTKLHNITHDYSRSGFTDILFILPLTILTGIPNLVAYQTSVKISKFIEILSYKNEARGNIFSNGVLNTNTFHRYMEILAEKEVESTSSLMISLHNHKESSPFDPETTEFNEYSAAYYALDDIVSDSKDKILLVISYISALMHIAAYCAGKTKYVQNKFVEAPLAGDICSVLKTLLKHERLRPREKSYIKVAYNTRTFNRYPILEPA